MDTKIGLLDFVVEEKYDNIPCFYDRETISRFSTFAKETESYVVVNHDKHNVTKMVVCLYPKDMDKLEEVFCSHTNEDVSIDVSPMIDGGIRIITELLTENIKSIRKRTKKR